MIRKAILFLLSHRTLAVLRWDLHFMIVRLKNVLTGQRGRLSRFMATRVSPVYLNLGSGPRGLDSAHWVNIDGFRDRNVHFEVDFARGLPFADASLDGVFCEHVIEHFSYEGARRLCAEIARVLKPGGVVRIIVPDAERVVRTYAEDPARLIAYRGLEGATAMQVVNDFFRQRYEHQFLFDWETMERMLGEAGLGDARRCEHGKGRCPDLLIDDPKYAWESLYAEAARSAPAQS